MSTVKEIRLQSEVNRLQRELSGQRDAAEKDRLTRLDNRLGFERRTTARGGWFVACDLDGFKRAQDGRGRGHEYGDRVLIEFAEFLLYHTRHGTDRAAARTGGDEFVVWVPTQQAAQRVASAVDEWRSADGLVSASAGIGVAMDSADAEMYQKKRSKRSWLKSAAEFIRGWVS